MKVTVRERPQAGDVEWIVTSEHYQARGAVPTRADAAGNVRAARRALKWRERELAKGAP